MRCALAILSVSHVHVFLTVLPIIGAKTLCDMVLLSHLRPEDVIRYELESFLPGKNNPFVPAYYTIDREKGLVEVGFLGNVGRTRYISPVLGCVTDTEPESNDAVLPPGVAKAFVKPIEYVSPTFGNATLCNKDERVRMTKDRVAALQRVLDEEIAAADQYGGPHTRALVVLHCGKLIGEAYAADLNVSDATPLMGWSMTKSLLSVLVAMRVDEGKLNWNSKVDLHEDGNDDHDRVTAQHLMDMTDGLDYRELYGFTEDPARMLYMSKSTAKFARSKGEQHMPGTRWCYHSGATNVLSELLEKSFDSREEYLEYPYRRLFAPLGAETFRMEVDREGHFVGSSLGFASARDWARLGQLMLQMGQWDGKEIVPESYVASIFKPLNLSGGIYAGGWWHAPPPAVHANLSQVYSNPADAACAARYAADMRASLLDALPTSAAMAMGFRQQWLVVSPEQNLVLVRLGHNWPVDRRGHFYSNITAALFDSPA